MPKADKVINKMFRGAFLLACGVPVVSAKAAPEAIARRIAGRFIAKDRLRGGYG